LGKDKNNSTLFWNKFKSPIGDVFVAWKKEGVFQVSFIEKNYSEKLSPFIEDDFKIVRSDSSILLQLKKYFEGMRREFDCNLLMNGTVYQKKVWKYFLEIPYGTTLSYGEVAKRIGNPGGARSIGMAAHLNPIGIIIPCHRIIRSSGDIGGYASGVNRKKWLLEHEHRNITL
jgi:methylated-DNA-[protein]-cysteine S-methyltransferase